MDQSGGYKTIRYLAFEDQHHPSEQALPDMTDLTSIPPDNPGQLCFQSSCSLENAVRLILCRDMSREHNPIIGMMITDIYKRKTCLGQFRFDQRLESLQITENGTLHFGAARTKKSFLYITNVWTEAPIDSSQVFLLTIPLKGTLVWRFSLQHTELYHSSLQGFWRPLNHLRVWQ